MVRLIPLFPGLVALITFVLARPFSPPRRSERKLVALVAMLDKLPDTPQFARSRRQLELRTANAAARAAAGQHVPSPWATYLVYTMATVVAAVITWWIWGSSDPTLFHWWAQLGQKLSLIAVVVLVVTGLWQRTLWDVHQRRRRATQQPRRRWPR